LSAALSADEDEALALASRLDSDSTSAVARTLATRLAGAAHGPYSAGTERGNPFVPVCPLVALKQNISVLVGALTTGAFSTPILVFLEALRRVRFKNRYMEQYR
jgi:hypothetical protein